MFLSIFHWFVHDARAWITTTAQAHPFWVFPIAFAIAASESFVGVSFIIPGTTLLVALGGVIIALIVVSPKLISSIKAGLADEPQRAANLALGSCAPAMGVILPVILGIGLVTGKTIIMGVVPSEVILVRVASFTFRFSSIKQLQDCIKYYEQKVHPSSRVAAKTIAEDIGPDWRELRGWEVERWFERLPMYLLEEPKRQKVLKALCEALTLVEAGKL